MAGPLDLRGRVIITDAGATGTLSRIQGLMAGIAGAAKAPVSALGAVQRQGRQLAAGGTGMGGLGATFLGGYFLKSQYDLEKALNYTQSFLDITDKTKFKPLRDEVIRLATAYPAMSHEIAKGTAEMAQAGMPLDTIRATLESTVQGAMASKESIKTVAAGVTDVVLGMGMPFKTAAEQAKAFYFVNNVMAASAASANDTYVGFLHGLSKAAPVARALGVDLQTLAAAHGTLANAGIKAERAGTALRTMMVRMLVPTKKAREQMAAEGIDLSRFTRIDTSKLSGGGLQSALMTGLGLDTRGISGAIEEVIRDRTLQNNVGVMGDKLTELIASHLKIDEGDVEGRKALTASIRNYLASTASKLDFKGAFKYLGDKNASVAVWKELFGVRHIEKAATLIEQMASGKFDEVLQNIIDKSPGAVARRAGIQMQGYVGAVDRMISAWDGFLRTLADTGVIDNVTNAITSVTQAITSLAKSNPKLLEFGTYAVLAAAAAAPLGFALAGLAKGLGVLVRGASLILKFSGALAVLRSVGAGAVAILGALGRAVARLALGKTLAAGGAGIVGGMGLGGAATVAGGGVVAGAAAKKVGRKVLLRFIPGVGLALTGVGVWDAIQEYRKTGDTKKAGEAFLMGQSDPRQAARDANDRAMRQGWMTSPIPSTPPAAPGPPASPTAPNVFGRPPDQPASGVVDETAQAMQRAQEIIRSVDLTSEGRRIMESLAAGLRAGISSVDAAMGEAAASVRAGAAKVRLNTGPAMRGAN